MWGTFFDTAWHRTLARDTFWSLPHLFIYGGCVVAWAAVTTAVALASRGRLHDLGGPVARVGPLRLPFGFTLAALGIVTVVGAAPVDIWYHGTFGKDVLIWSPPHMQALGGGIVAAAGMMFAAAAQRGRGPFSRPWLWTLAVLLPAVYVLHLAHYALAHYTMTPWTRTPDFYPLLAAIMFPAVLVALARVAGPPAPVLASLLFLGASMIVDISLRTIGFERYTITPVIAVPALAIAATIGGASHEAPRAWRAAVAGAAFTLTFIATEAVWMAWVIGNPWPRTVAWGSTIPLVAGALSGLVGWAWGGFMAAPTVAGGAAVVFGGRRRAQAAAVGAVALIVAGVASVYRPQTYGPAMTVPELALKPSTGFIVQEALFWEAVLDEDFGQRPQLAAYSEGIIDGIPLPIGPAWCAADAGNLARELPHVRFALEVNGAPVDLSSYPIVRLRIPDGRECGWIGVISRRQRASRNRFRYAITPLAGAPPTVRAMQIDLTAVFKDP